MAQFHAVSTLWPLCLTIAEGRQSPAHHDEMLAAWDDWFARRERFFALRIYLDEAALEQVPGTARTTKKWLNGGAAENMKRFTAAMAIVVPGNSHMPEKRPSVEKVFGIPGGIFPGLDEAAAWLTGIEGFPAQPTSALSEAVEQTRNR